MINLPFMTPRESVSACLLHLRKEYVKCHQAMQNASDTPFAYSDTAGVLNKDYLSRREPQS